MVAKRVYARQTCTTVKTPDGKWVKLVDLICGNCGSVLYGYDEDVCPVCAANNDFSRIPE